MSRTIFRCCWFRRTCTLVAGLMAVLVAPLPSGVPGAQAGVANQAKIYVFPYQPVFKGVPKEITTQTSDLLKTEIKHNDEVQLQKGPIFIPETVATEVKPLSDKDLKQAGKLHQKGERYYHQLKLDRAQKSFQGALAKYEKSLALIQNFDPVVATLLMLSVCNYRLDNEDEGAKMLVKVIRLRPDLVLDPEKYPPMFRNTMDSIRKRLLRKTRGELEVVANSDGATVFFDGRQVGKTPILLKDLVPGEHYVRVEKEGLQTYAAKTVIVPTKKVRVAAVLGGVKKAAGPLGEIAEAIRSNSVSSKVIDTVRSQGRKIRADFVVIGGVAKVGGNFKVGSFLIKVAGRSDKSVCKLMDLQFDPDLLGAAVEMFNMASDMVKRVEGCAESVKPPIGIIQTAVASKDEPMPVSVGPPVPPKEAPVRRPAARPEARVPAPAVREPARPGAPRVPAPPRPVPTLAHDQRQPGRTPAPPARQDQPRRRPAPPRVTPDGLVTTGPSVIRQDPLVVPRVPRAQRGMPIIKDEDTSGTRWYQHWWVWTIVGAVAVGGAVGGMALAGMFEGDVSGGSVDVFW